jgi:ABC-type nitrate/sulfonate/bicarbonate transport system permease component
LHKSVIGPLVLILVWWIASTLQITSPLILPTPQSVARAFFAGASLHHGVWNDLGVTLRRTSLSFLISVAAGVPFGLLMGISRFFQRLSGFLVDFFRSIPPIALFPLFLLAFGLGERSKSAVSVYGCALIIAVNSCYGVTNAPTLRRRLARVYGFSQSRVFFKVILPDSLPQILVGCRTAISLALVLTIVVEMMLGSEDGLGRKIYEAHMLLETPTMYSNILWVGILGYGLNLGVMTLEKHLVHWANK